MTEGLLAQTMAIVSSRLSAARSLLQRHNLYGSPPRHSFYSCASSRALLHVGSLSLWDRHPSNAPPLLLSPAGLASRRGPHTKTHLGLCPKTPYPLSCGWIRIGFFSYRRKINPYGAADTLSRCLRRILFWFLQTDSRKSCCRAYGLNKQLFAQTAPPPPRGRGRGCGAERRQWRMQRGGAPAAVEKIEQASSAKIFSGTARRWGQMCPLHLISTV